MRRLIINGIVCMSVLALSGCASIVSKSNYPVRIDSTPPGAFVTIKDNSGRVIQQATTPLVVTLDASDGFFSNARYQFLFEKEGYNSTLQMLSAKIDGWYVGNIVFGGLIGLLIVDPATGAMWKLPSEVHGYMVPVAVLPPSKSE